MPNLHRSLRKPGRTPRSLAILGLIVQLGVAVGLVVACSTPTEPEEASHASATGPEAAVGSQTDSDHLASDDPVHHYTSDWHHSGTNWGKHRLASQYHDEDSDYWIHNNGSKWHNVSNPSISTDQETGAGI